MRDRALGRGEIVLVASCVLLACVFVITVWVPVNWQEGLQRAQSTWGLPVADVGRQFSGWTFGDGQAYAIVATDPLGTDVGATLGDPAYRYSRLGFGLLVWALSLGQAHLIPYAITAAGLLAVGGLWMVAWKLRPRIGPSAWILCLNPAVYIALARGTAESVGALILALALVSGSVWWAGVLAAVRPSFLLGLLGRPKQLMAGGLVFAGIAALAALQFGWDPSQYGGRLSWPLLGYLESADIASWVVAGCALFTFGVGLKTRNWTWVVTGLFLLCLSGAVVGNYRNSIRVAGVLPVLWALGPRYQPATATAPARRRLVVKGELTSAKAYRGLVAIPRLRQRVEV